MLTETKMEHSGKPTGNGDNNNGKTTLQSNCDCETPISEIGKPPLANGKIFTFNRKRLFARLPSSNRKLPYDNNKPLDSINVELPLNVDKLLSASEKLHSESNRPPSDNDKLAHNCAKVSDNDQSLSDSNKLSANCKLAFGSDKLTLNTEKALPDTDKIPFSTEKLPFANSKLPSDNDKIPYNSEKATLPNDKVPTDSECPRLTNGKCPDSGKPPAPPELEDCPFNLERILCELGSFGKYQLLLLALLAFRDSFLQMCNFNYVFTAAEVNFRCVIPECESGENLNYNASFVHYALPNLTNTCFRLASGYAGGGDASPANGQWNSSGVCTPGAFVDAKLVPCERRVYEDYNSMYAEFDLGCSPWKRTLIGTVHNLGLLFSFLLSGLISDRYGRKVIIVGTPLVVGAAGILKSFAQSYWTVVMLEFLETALGYGNASMVLSLELVSQNHRVVFSCLCDMAANFGGAFFGALAWRVRNWRVLLRAIYAPLLAAIAYIFVMDEGVRWLVAHGKREEAARVLHKVAKYNNVTLSRRAASMLHELAHRKEKEPEIAPRCELLSALCSRKILLRVLLLAACFLCCLFVYSGSIIYSTSLTGDKFVNFSTMWVVAIPTRALTALALTRWGRRVPLCVAYCLCGACFLACAFVPTEWRWMTISLYAVGAMCSSFGVFAVTVFALELLPTRARNSLLNVACTAGRLGNVLAPQAPLLARVWSGLPNVAFGVAALCAGSLCVMLPDTSRADLPDRVPDAETLAPTTTATATSAPA